MKNKQSISAIKSGLNKDAHSSQLNQTEFSLLVNGNSENETGGYNIQNEPSNILGTLFPESYKVLGFKNDLLQDKTYFFLTNPTTKKSSIGYVTTVIDDTFNQDEELECEDCSAYNQLGEPLENKIQVPSSEYIEILNDNCYVTGEGLNFDINFPIKKIEIKQEKLGTYLYWNDNRNPPRFMNVSDTSYLFTEEVPCEDNTTVECPLLDKLLIFPKHNKLQVEAEELQIGGNLKLGTYEFYVAYCDLMGNEMTQYSTPTNPISIFDENNNILNQTELDIFTNYAIKLKVKNLNTEYFKYYKVVCVERNNVDNTQSGFIYGIYPTTDDTVLYTSSGSSSDDFITRGNVSIKRRIDFNKLNLIKPYYDKAETTMVSGNRLWHKSLTKKEEINLQPVVNLFGAIALEWQTVIAKEDLYKSAIATSKYKGYMRDEVQPFGLRFYFKDGDYSAVFPIVGRPSMDGDRSIITDKNFQSLNANTPNCTTTDRNEKWQMKNTAIQTDVCSSLNGIEAEEDIQKSCVLENIFTIPAGSTSIGVDAEYYDLASWVESNNVDGITEYLDAVYPGNCTPYYNDGCTLPPNLLSESNSIQEINGETKTSTPKLESEYSITAPPSFCDVYKVNSTDGLSLRDTIFEANFMNCGEKVYERNSDFENEDCNYATTVLDTPSVSLVGIFLNYEGADLKSDLLTAIDVTTVDSNFENKIHSKAQYFKVVKNGRDNILLEITKTTNCGGGEDNLPQLNKLRYTIFDNCSDYNELGGAIFPTNTNYKKLIDVSTFGNEFVIVVDAPISTNSITDCTPTTKLVYKVSPPCGCFSMFSRDVEYKDIEVSWDSIILKKTQNYETQCTFFVPKVDECDPQPYTKGLFSFWESTENYADNKELFDSSNLIISEGDLSNLSEDKKILFREFFTNGTNGEVYKLTESTDLRCKPIRHPKFPDNTITPFINSGESTKNFTESTILPLGITIDDKVVRTMLSVALKNDLITEKEFNNIGGYEILRGDNSISKSIIASGLGFDYYKYSKDDEDWWYSNFPLNDLGEDKFNIDNKTNKLIQHPFGGDSNFMYSFLSPDLVLTKPALPTEVVLSGYQLGGSNLRTLEVEDHPKWVILGKKAYNTALQLALLESALEIAIKTTEFVVNSAETTRVYIWAVAGAGSTGGGVDSNPIGVGTSVGSIITYGVLAAASQFITLGKRRYEWMKIFEDLGKTDNFANYQLSIGNYNKFLPNTKDADYVRGLSVKKYLKDTLYNIVDENDGETYHINAKRREYSVYLSTGKDYKFEYEASYSKYDNNKENAGFSSKATAFETGCTLSNNNFRNAGSPYLTLRNYVPDQWGQLDSIKWLTTNSIFNIDEDTSCKPIFGGTVSISRFSWIRKVPFFDRTAMKTPDRMAFNYSDNGNIGKPKYYLDHKVSSVWKALGVPYPDIDNNYELDCLTGKNDWYVEPPSKFYLYSYGVVDFLVESEVNCNFRYAREGLREGFYPQLGDMVDRTQEKNVSINEPNTFYYNNTYSFPVSNTPYKYLDVTYNKEIWRKRNLQPNAVIYSEMDNNENDLTDPWRVYKPINWYEYRTNLGKLINLKDIESQQFFAMFENGLILNNAIDTLAERTTTENRETGLAGIFAQRPLEFKTTDLGFAGTQHTEICSTPNGHIFADTKRGRVFQVDQNGKNIEIISESVQGQPTNMKQWFREHLPFKILKYFPEIDVDNKFKGIGLNMWYDDRNSRVFVTKRDYKVINTECLKYEEGIGFYEDCSVTELTCPIGYTFNDETQQCEKLEVTPVICSEGFVYNSSTEMCEQETGCEEGLDIVFILDATGSQQYAIDNIKSAISTQIVPSIIENFGADYRLGLISVKDRRVTGQALFDILEPMSIANEGSFVTQINTVYAGGGSSNPEPTDVAIEATLNNTSAVDFTGASLGGNTIGLFRDNAAKVIILVTDEIPSGLDDLYSTADWLKADLLATQASEQGVQIFSYLTSGSEQPPTAPPLPNVTYVMQNYTTKTMGVYYFTPLGVGISDGVVNAIVSEINCPPPNQEEPTCLDGCIPISGECICSETQNPSQVGVITPISFDNKAYFKDVSWTLSYKPQEGKWNSFFTFYPDYSPFHNGFFQVGYNWGDYKETMWSHLMNNSSFQVFQGKINPFVIEFPIQNENVLKQFNSVSLNVEARRYNNKWDFSIWKDKGFDTFSMFTETKHTGALKLFPQKSLSDNRKYPKTNNNNTQDILFTSVDGHHNINYFFNRVIQQQRNIPMYLRDDNNIFKTINPRAISFTGKSALERMTGEFSVVRLENSTESRFNIVLKNSTNNETVL